MAGEQLLAGFRSIWIVGALLAWIYCDLMFAWMNGWLRIAREYRARERFVGPRYFFQTIHLGTSYSTGVTVGANEMGMYITLWPWLLARFSFHRPLFLPWADLDVQEEPWRAGNLVKFIPANAPGNAIKLSERLALKLRADSGGAFEIGRERLTCGPSGPA